MKKILTVLVLIIAMLVSLAACGKSAEKLESTEKSETVMAEEESEKEAEAETSAEPEEAPAEEASEASEESEAPAEVAEPVVVIEEQVLIDQDGVKITAKSTADDSEGTPIIALVYENQTDKQLVFKCDHVILNGYTFEDVRSSMPVEAGSTVEDILYYRTSPELEYFGITPETIGEIGMTCHVVDQETYSDVFEVPVKIQTAAYDSMETAKIEDGVVLYDKNGLKVTGKYVVDDSLMGTAIATFIENNTDKTVRYWTYGAEFNGTDVKVDYTGVYVYAGGMKLGSVPIDPAALAENNIETVESIRVSFAIEDETGYDVIDDVHLCYLMEPEPNPGHISDAAAFESFDTLTIPAFDEDKYEIYDVPIILGQTLVREAYTGPAAATMQDADETHEAIENPDTLEPGATGFFVASASATTLMDALAFYVYNPTDAPIAFEDSVITGIYNKNLTFSNGIEAQVFNDQPVEDLITPILGEPYDIRLEPANEVITNHVYRWKDEDDTHSLKIVIVVRGFDDDRQLTELQSIEYINRSVVKK